MTAVLVHGNPETAAIWGPLLNALDREDVVALSPPGFGAPVPDGWMATRAEYAAWLATKLEAMDEPVDLVGHDWGGGHVVAVAMARAVAEQTGAAVSVLDGVGHWWMLQDPVAAASALNTFWTGLVR